MIVDPFTASFGLGRVLRPVRVHDGLWSITWPKWLLPVTIVSDATIRSDIMSRKKWLGCYLHWWSQDWTTVMQHWPVCHWRLSRHYSKFNLAAHLIFELSTPEHVTLCLLQLCSVFHGMCLTYLSNTIEPISAGWRWYGLLWSSGSGTTSGRIRDVKFHCNVSLAYFFFFLFCSNFNKVRSCANTAIN